MDVEAVLVEPLRHFDVEGAARKWDIIKLQIQFVGSDCRWFVHHFRRSVFGSFETNLRLTRPFHGHLKTA